LKAGLRSPTLRESKKPPATIERVSFSPKKSTALITVTSGSSVDTKEAFAAPILPSPAKNDQKATTVEKNAIASVAVTPKALSGSDTPLERAMHKYDTEALRIMKALPAIAVLVPTTRELMMMYSEYTQAAERARAMPFQSPLPESPMTNMQPPLAHIKARRLFLETFSWAMTKPSKTTRAGYA
jgi:hypothetical protein